MAAPQGMVATSVAGGSPVTFNANGVEFLRLTESTQDEVVFNEGSVDIDFRIESNGQTHMFFVDGANDWIGIRNSAPAYPIDIIGGTEFGIEILLGSNRTNSTRKTSMLGMAHYTNAEEPLTLIWGDASNATNASNVYVGGGFNAGNAATSVYIVAAANATTIAGTQFLQVDGPNTEVVINPTGADQNFRVLSDTASGVFGTDGAGAGFAYFAPNPNGAQMQIKCVSTTVTADVGASVTATNLIPANAKFLGVTTRITTALGETTGTTGYNVGDGTDADRWGTASGVTAGTTSSVPTAEPFGFTLAAANVVLTATGGNFDGTGVVRIIVHYITYAGPTS